MTRFVFASVLLLAATSIPSALAADKHTASTPDWSGYYAGVTVGSLAPQLALTDVGYSGHTFAASGVTGQVFHDNNLTYKTGATLGWNRQTRLGVFGAETEFGWLDLNGTKLDPGTGSNTHVGLDSGLYGSITGRVGKNLGKALIYGKGGWTTYSGDYLFTTQVSITAKKGLGLFQGYTAGGGVEYRVLPKWSVKGEYLYSDFGTQTLSQNSFPFKENLATNTFSMGVNYRFLTHLRKR
jgi:outer membrane immunogenic protein